MLAESRSEESEQTQANEGKGREAVYEIGLHLLPARTEEEVAAAFAHLHSALDSMKAEVLVEDLPKRIPLAYRIERSVAGKREKYTEAHFGFIKFELPEAEEVGTHIPTLEKMLKEDSNVLRYLLIKTTREAPVAPRATFASKSLEGRTIERPVARQEERGEVSEEELEKSIEALVGDEGPTV